MSGHADTIRRVLQQLGLPRYGQFERPAAQEGLDALDALVAENQRLRDALTAIASWESPLGVEYAAECYSKAQAVARAALAGTPSEDA
jgi:hypothetical protein